MLKKLFLLPLLLGASYSYADPQCTEAPEAQWMAFATAKQQVIDQGYTIKKFKKTSTSCYEMYGKDSAGKRVEIYFDPTDMSVIKEKR